MMAYHVDRRDQIGALTPREREVLDLLAGGLSTKEIGARLCISRSTLQHHIAGIYAKTGCRNRAQAAIYAMTSRTHTTKEGT
jgi:DNA-binding CsgD family transcriptional regulator